MAWVIVYNSGTYPVVVTEQGHMADPATFSAADEDVMNTGGVEYGNLIVIDPGVIGDDSDPVAKMVKQEVADLNAELAA